MNHDNEQPMATGKQFPTRAQVVIIGGGVIGSSVAYHLTKLGWNDVVLLEKSKLTSGTTWHAAGLIVSGGMTSETYAWMARYTRELIEGLEEETGLSTGFQPVGYLQTGSSPQRLHKLRREADFLRLMGIERQEVSPAEVAKLWPQLDVSEVLGGFYTAEEGRADPANVSLALAKGARMGGVRVFEDTAVTDIDAKNGRITGVKTTRGDIEAEYVVNCAGMWAREIGAMAGVSVPLQAAEHAYLITEPFDGVSRDQPILEDPDRHAYYREETGGMMIGLFEPVAAPWGVDGIPDKFSFGEITSDWDRLMPFLEKAMEPMPILRDVGLRKLFTGPESFTPDNGSLMGEAPELKNFFVAAGYNSLGILLGGGAGSIIANWIVDGLPPVDVTAVDIARVQPFQTSRSYLKERIVELLGSLHTTGSWPTFQPATARDVRRSAVHDRLAAAGAHFGESSGWENAEWFAPPGTEVDVTYSYGRQGWFDYQAEEHRAVREGVALFELSSMSKFLVQGPDAESLLNRISGNNLSVPVGRCVYTQWMNVRGGVETDVTVTRLADDQFLVVSAELFHRRVETMLKRSINADSRVWITDVTSGYTLLSVQGPNSRQLLSKLTTADLANEAFPYFTAQQLDLHHGLGWAFRMSFVGELGWELYIPTEFSIGVYDAIIVAGTDLGLRHAGIQTLETARTEAGRRDYGLDMENSDTALEAGLGFALDFDKPGGFVGREALLKQKEAGPLKRRLVQFLLDDPEPLLFGEEPIYRDGKPVGYMRSGAYGHTLGGAMGFGYVENAEGVPIGYLKDGNFEIEIASERFSARASIRAMYDPKNERVHM